MKGKLFQVRLSSYKSYYVIANNYNEAVAKTESHLHAEQEVKSILSEDGSLNLNKDTEANEVKAVEMLTNDLIF